jgi:maltose alpha-D-glucosyltransferase/alpha-amylase
LDHEGSGYKSLVRDYRLNSEGRPVEDRSFFKKDGSGDINHFLNQYMPWYESTKTLGFMSLISGNHDTPRLGFNLSPEELALFYGVLFTLPGVPFLYYGDEIGMRYLYGLPSKEGGYTRTGARTPMQWTEGPNKGFSAASSERLYLPVDPSPLAPSVEVQQKDPRSLLNTVKALLRLRLSEPDLQGKPNLEIIHADGLPFMYRRGAFVVSVNPSETWVNVKGLDFVNHAAEAVYKIGSCSLENGVCDMGGQSFGVWRV